MIAKEDTLLLTMLDYKYTEVKDSEIPEIRNYYQIYRTPDFKCYSILGGNKCKTRKGRIKKGNVCMNASKRLEAGYFPVGDEVVHRLDKEEVLIREEVKGPDFLDLLRDA